MRASIAAYFQPPLLLPLPQQQRNQDASPGVAESPASAEANAATSRPEITPPTAAQAAMTAGAVKAAVAAAGGPPHADLSSIRID